MDRPLYIPGVKRSPQPLGWGTPMPLLHGSIAEIHEKPFVAKVLSDLHYRSSIFNLKDLEIRDARILTEIELRGFDPKLSGDIDILVVPLEHAERATAIQVKRFKVGRRAVRTGRPNGLGEFRKGVRQANDLVKLGFSQVYLWVFVLVDTREQNEGRFCYDGPTADLRSHIESVISTAALNPRVGLMTFEWVQLMDRPPLELGTYGGHLRRLAERTQQPRVLTDWLATLTQIIE